MKTIKVMATIDEQGQLTLDQPLHGNHNRRVEVIILMSDETESDEAEENDERQVKADLLEDFRQAWHEAKTGQTIPVAQLWEDLEDV